MDSKVLVSGSVGFVAGIASAFAISVLFMSGMMRQGDMMHSQQCNGLNSRNTLVGKLAITDEFIG